VNLASTGYIHSHHKQTQERDDKTFKRKEGRDWCVFRPVTCIKLEEEEEE
jgi:hypothetical protein